MRRSVPFDVYTLHPPHGLASGETFSFPYVVGASAVSYEPGAEHRIMSAQGLLAPPSDFALAFGESQITLTWLHETPARRGWPVLLQIIRVDPCAVSAPGGSGSFSISSFGGNFVSPREIGHVLAEATLTWSLSGLLPAVQSIVGPGFGAGLLPTSRPAEDRSVAVTGLSISSDTSWTLSANPTGWSPVTATLAVTFGRRMFVGRGPLAAPDEAAIEAMPSTIRTSRASTTGVLANGAGSAGEYVWLAFPDAWATGFQPLTDVLDPVTGFNVPFTDQGTLSVTNAYGDTATYRRFRSLNALNGAISVRVT